MKDDELRSIVSGYINDAVGYMDSTIASERQKALDYYYGRPFGNEIEGRSSVITTDVADTIESVLPSLLKMFTAGDEVVEFEAVGPEDESEAQQKTDVANYVFYKENDGFLLLHNWFKDALLQKNGFVKHWWEEKKNYTSETYSGLDEEQYQAMIADERNEVLEMTQNSEVITVIDPMSGQPIEQNQTTYDLKIRQEKVIKKVCLENVPPEEMIITRNARDIDGAALVGHRCRKTVSDLLEMGYKMKDIEDCIGEGDASLTGEEQSRFNDEGGFWGRSNSTTDVSMQEVWLIECYVNVDFNGDGIAELRKITVAGREAYKLLDNEEYEGMKPFSSLCPIIMPHKLFGRSLAELIMDIQLIKSTVLRQWLDNMYLTNNQRIGAVDGKVNLDDLLTNRPGGVVRLKDPNAIVPIMTPQLGNQAPMALEYLDSIKENRTGITKYNQGMDANSLNKTATGINAIMGAAQQRLELIARIFAETGVKRLFRAIIELNSKYQDKSKIIRIRNEYVTVDPTSWKNDQNVTINVGLGTGNKDQQLMHLMQILGIQKELIQSPFSQMVSAENIYNSIAEVAKNSGFKNPDKFLTNPRNVQPQEQQPPAPDPAMIKIQQDGQIKQQQMQMDAQQAQAKMQADMAVQENQLQLKQQEMMMQLDLEKYKFDQQLALQKELAIIDKVMNVQQAQVSAAQNMDEDAVIEEPQVNPQMDALIAAISTAAHALAAPRQLVRDAQGNIQGAVPMMGNQ